MQKVLVALIVVAFIGYFSVGVCWGFNLSKNIPLRWASLSIVITCFMQFFLRRRR